jgi:hypothetical protein
MSQFLVAQFDRPDAVLEAARGAFEAGMAAEDALCSTPVEGVFDCLAPPHRKKPIGWIMFVSGLVGAIAGYFMQWYSAAIDYPINSGGRPLNSWPAFLLVPYEMAILLAATIGILAWMWLCGLPRLYHPLFDLPVVERANQDRYLLIFAADPKTRAWLNSHWPGALVEQQP